VKHNILFFLALLGVLLLIYFDSFQHPFTFLDDQVQVVENPNIRSLHLKSIVAIFNSTSVGMYQPLTTLCFALIYGLLGSGPFGFHLFSFGIHLFNTYLLFRLLQFFPWKKEINYLLLALFALHPMQVESIAWISASSNVLFTSFYLLSIIQYVLYLKKQNNKNLLLSLLFFCLSCLSKSYAVSLPIVLILFDRYFRKDNSIQWFNKLPFIALSVLVGVVTILSRESAGHLSDLSISFGLLDRIFLSAYAFLFYPIKFLLPVSQSIFYPYPALNNDLLPWQYYASLVIVGLLLFLLWRYRKEKAILLGAGFFVLSIAPVLQLIPVGNQLTTDRYIYLPMIGLLIIIGSVLNKLSKTNYLWLLSLLPLFYVFQSKQRVVLWKSDQLLWQDVLTHYPTVAQAHNNLGSYLLKQGKVRKAFQHFNKAIELKPYYADAYSNRGNLYAQQQKSQLAIRDYEKAIQLRPHADAYFNRANERAKLGLLDEAISDYNQSISLKKSSDALTNRAYAYLKKSEIDKALSDLNAAIQLEATYEQAYFLRGMAYNAKGNKVNACSNFQKAIQLGSRNAQAAFQQYCKN
jgi:Tfp pilus assembly protein PilF